MNHFELFSLPVQFAIDTDLLSSRFRTLQSQFHPDKSATLSERERLMAVQKSAEINDAYQTLRTPVARAEYLLFLNDLDIRHEQSTINDGAFLMQQMELREQLEEVEQLSLSKQANAEDVKAEEALEEMETEADNLYKACYQTLEQQLDSEQWQLAADTIRQLKFWVKLRQEIEQLGDKIY